MIFVAVAAALLADSVPRKANLTGLYVSHQMEMGGALELGRTGHFRYELDYGAVSESAEGNWMFDGRSVRLTSNPMPKMPDFALVRDVPAPPGALYVAVQSDGDSWSPLAVLVMVDGIKRPMVLYADEDGRVVLPENRRAISVKMLLPVYETGGDPVTLSGNSGHRLLFRLEPNDIGKAPLHGERLAIEGASLVLYRYDRKILFRRVGSSDSKRRRH